MLPHSYFPAAETWLSLSGGRVGMTPKLRDTRKPQAEPSHFLQEGTEAKSGFPEIFMEGVN